MKWKRASGFGLLFGLAACVTPERQKTVELESDEAEISPILQQPTGRFLKRKVAIARFTNETNYGRSVFLDKSGDTIGKQASDVLSARLNASGKFILIERRDYDKLIKEAERQNLKPDLVGADFLILGSVTEFGRATTSRTGVFSKTKRQRAYAKVSLRLVDVRTGVTIHSDEGRGEAQVEAGKLFGIGTGASYDSTLSERAISSAISKVVSNIAENVLERPWQSYVLGMEDGEVIIGGGKHQGLATGDRFAIVRRGKRFKNPQTGAWVETPGKEVAEIEVVASFGETATDEGSTCKLVSGSIDPKAIGQLLVLEKK